jgi:hypothetical protein
MCSYISNLMACHVVGLTKNVPLEHASSALHMDKELPGPLPYFVRRDSLMV